MNRLQSSNAYRATLQIPACVILIGTVEPSVITISVIAAGRMRSVSPVSTTL
jgi:hypothetical protein